MLLGPYGMAGTLTGQSYKETDMGTQKILNDWNHFFPVKSRKAKDTVPEDDHITSMVEVIVGKLINIYHSKFLTGSISSFDLLLLLLSPR